MECYSNKFTSLLQIERKGGHLLGVGIMEWVDRHASITILSFTRYPFVRSLRSSILIKVGQPQLVSLGLTYVLLSSADKHHTRHPLRVCACTRVLAKSTCNPPNLKVLASMPEGSPTMAGVGTPSTQSCYVQSTEGVSVNVRALRDTHTCHT